ncbi:MAG: proline dehydrogenase [Ignavibacteriaceae bacterium]|nr:MAG: proline dehydrogenase [Chlorobiota bacterium]GJQ32644.1 MAG: proline dehydrogenase [Ignavibacteriaceae bacterium]
MLLLNKLIVAIVKLMPHGMVYFFAKRYIAGEKLQDAIDLVKTLNKKGILATMDVLGESITTKEEVILAKTECLAVLNAIHENKLGSNLSIKPTSLGLNIDPEFAYQQIKELVQRAKELNNFVRMDMEDSTVTQITIDVFKRLRSEYDNVGIVLQSYLKRTYNDVVDLNKIGTNYRLCKGIYIEPAEIAFREKQAVRDSYVRSLEKMMKDGNYVGIATHDDYLVKEALRLKKELNVPDNRMEFQMLYGVKEDLRDRLVKEGHKVRIYTPFGKDWYKYSIRRLQENPNVAGQVFTNIFKFGK